MFGPFEDSWVARLLAVLLVIRWIDNVRAVRGKLPDTPRRQRVRRLRRLAIGIPLVVAVVAVAGQLILAPEWHALTNVVDPPWWWTCSDSTYCAEPALSNYVRLACSVLAYAALSAVLAGWLGSEVLRSRTGTWNWIGVVPVRQDGDVRKVFVLREADGFMSVVSRFMPAHHGLLTAAVVVASGAGLLAPPEGYHQLPVGVTEIGSDASRHGAYSYALVGCDSDGARGQWVTTADAVELLSLGRIRDPRGRQALMEAIASLKIWNA